MSVCGDFQNSPHKLATTKDDDEISDESDDDLLLEGKRALAWDPLDELLGRVGEVELAPNRLDGSDERALARVPYGDHCC